MKFAIQGMMISLLLLCISPTLLAEADIAGAKDHPLLSRYPGAYIRGFTVTDVDEYRFPTGPAKGDQVPTQALVGKYTTIVYELPKQVSTLQVMTNYQDAFKKASVNVVFSCDQSSCGPYLPSYFVKSQTGGTVKASRYMGVDVYNTSERADYRFLAGKLQRNGKSAYLTFMVYNNGYSVTAFLDVLEEGSVKTGLVSLHPEALTDSNESQLLTKKPQQKDNPGSKDHPLVSRFPGSYIREYSYTDHDRYMFPSGIMENNALPVQEVQGKYTTIVYSLPDSVSTLQVMQNYQQAFNKANLKQVVSCDEKTCGGMLPKVFVEKQGGGNAKTARYLGVDVYNANERADYRFWSGSLNHNGNMVYITFMVQKNSGSVAAFLDVLEAGAMETGLVSLDLKGLNDAIENEGKAVLSGIYFDNDKATLKPESDASLKIIAQYLNTHGQNQVYIVGHTDNQGDYSHNLELSERRADAVIQALVKQYSININRLTAAGVGPVSPASNNKSENTRKTNRRVEMVLK